jgi:protein phosphatase
MTRTYDLPELCLVLLVGVSGSGKSTFARKHFLPSEIVSSDACRGLVSDDENDQAATDGAFALVHAIAAERLKYGKLAVIDATNIQSDARRRLVQLAREFHVLPIAIVIDTPERVCQDRNATRPDRAFGPHVIRNQTKALRRMFPSRKEGLHSTIVLKGDDIEHTVFVRTKLWTDKRDIHGPFDLIGDVHGCFDELSDLLVKLGWVLNEDRTDAVHPEGRTAVFLGDLVDRGPATPQVLRLAMNMNAGGTAICIPGNHEVKLLKALRGDRVSTSHGLAESLSQLNNEGESFRNDVIAFMDSMVSHFVLDDGKLVVAHAGVREDMQGRSSGVVRSFCLYGDTTGETDEFGLPIRYPWADEYRGKAAVVYGHTPVVEAEWINNTLCVDTGCVFGGSLTALRWPEREVVSVDAREVYYEPIRPLDSDAPIDAIGSRGPLELDLDDVAGTRRIQTSLNGTVTVREEQTAAALEVMSRFAADPRWLVYLPPTMAPPATSLLDGYLEHPEEAFAQFRSLGVSRVICEEKHMGSRAVVIVGRNPKSIEDRFKITSDCGGNVLTRTGRSFFSDGAWTASLIERTRAAIDAIGLWDELRSDWFVLDTELLPWSAKAEELLRQQYAAVGAASTSSLAAAQVIADQIAARLTNDVDAESLATRVASRFSSATKFVDSYRRYVWEVTSPLDLQIAPFQVLAGEGETLGRRPHLWHLEIADRLRAYDSQLFRETRRIEVDLDEPESERAGTDWWLDMTAAGGEGMVVKPLNPVTMTIPITSNATARTRITGGLVQPGVKVRGREYLRIIYGPEYTDPANLLRLRNRGLGHKRSLALREFALGIEGLDRFVANEPLYKVHECAFGVLSLESDPVDPRL